MTRQNKIFRNVLLPGAMAHLFCELLFYFKVEWAVENQFALIRGSAILCLAAMVLACILTWKTSKIEDKIGMLALPGLAVAVSLGNLLNTWLYS